MYTILHICNAVLKGGNQNTSQWKLYFMSQFRWDYLSSLLIMEIVLFFFFLFLLNCIMLFIFYFLRNGFCCCCCCFFISLHSDQIQMKIKKNKLLIKDIESCKENTKNTNKDENEFEVLIFENMVILFWWQFIAYSPFPVYSTLLHSIMNMFCIVFVGKFELFPKFERLNSNILTLNMTSMTVCS